MGSEHAGTASAGCQIGKSGDGAGGHGRQVSTAAGVELALVDHKGGRVSKNTAREHPRADVQRVSVHTQSGVVGE